MMYNIDVLPNDQRRIPIIFVAVEVEMRDIWLRRDMLRLSVPGFRAELG